MLRNVNEEKKVFSRIHGSSQSEKREINSVETGFWCISENYQSAVGACWPRKGLVDKAPKQTLTSSANNKRRSTCVDYNQTLFGKPWILHQRQASKTEEGRKNIHVAEFEIENNINWTSSSYDADKCWGKSIAITFLPIQIKSETIPFNI